MTASETAKTLAFSAAQAAADKKAFAINLRDVTSKIALTDVFVIVSASNERQVHAVVDAVEERLIKEHDTRPLRREGKGGEQWVLLDYNEIVVHVFHQEARVFYGLDGLWKDCPEIEFVDQAEAERERRAEGGDAEDGDER
ncbi:ribosome silencing factor [Glycomyces terrestris]|uniref:Ribosomal silencing factor RsfS n=1 Tax=Glycomyces terrestris TaxID=2493553 RepID=A0A426UZP0_9ACTN|nr:ribosome silencing factor [Glycomyces terrestris]RRS00067.1 ribosome silencing factor [Glycomyces terrestris]